GGIGLGGRVPGHELGRDAVLDAKQVVEHKYLAVAPWTGADADRGHGHGLGDGPGHTVGHRFQHDGEAACLGQGHGVVDEGGSGGGLLALDLEAAELVDRLGCEPEVTHDRPFRVEDRLDHVDTLATTFELHRLGPGTHQGGRV